MKTVIKKVMDQQEVQNDDRNLIALYEWIGIQDTHDNIIHDKVKITIS